MSFTIAKASFRMVHAKSVHVDSVLISYMSSKELCAM